MLLKRWHMPQFLLWSRFTKSVITAAIVLALLPAMAFAQPEPSCSVFGYYDAKGTLVHTPALKAPLVDGTRISDEYGMRLHPVLKRWSMHFGVDIAAPAGSPIYTPGDGVVMEAGFQGASGLYVRVLHDNTHETAYSHGSRLAPGIKAGARVKRGQPIMFVGSTGLTDGGAHVHFEIFVNRSRVRPAVGCGTVLVAHSRVAAHATRSPRGCSSYEKTPCKTVNQTSPKKER